MKFLSGPCTAEWAIDCFLYSPPSFFLNTAINFLSCLTNSFSLPSPPPPTALFVAEEDAQSIGGILQTTQPLQPGRNGPVPGSFSRERPADQKSPGIRAHTCKNWRGGEGVLLLTPLIQLLTWNSVGFLASGGAFPSYHSGSMLPPPLSELHPVSSLPGRGGQADISSAPRPR